MISRRYTTADQVLMQFDLGLRTLFAGARASRPNPAAQTSEDETALSAPQRAQAARLMRVNHCGEVCAQALYQGQALGTRNQALHASLQQAAREENDHLAWCETRLRELDARKSVLNPLFYASSFAIGFAASRLGDRWNLGFLAETERQVVRHLEQHLQQLPEQDGKSRTILAAMKEDEAQHATNAQTAGGIKLPLPVRWLMRASAKVMTKSTYWL